MASDGPVTEYSAPRTQATDWLDEERPATLVPSRLQTPSWIDAPSSAADRWYTKASADPS